MTIEYSKNNFILFNFLFKISIQDTNNYWLNYQLFCAIIQFLFLWFNCIDGQH
jgi:hypothetical protein